MSKRQSKTGVPHLTFQAQAGFQYYLTFPKHFALNPKLPAQIRWVLGHDEALARDLAHYLNERLPHLIAKTDEFRAEHMPESTLTDLAELHTEVARTLDASKKIWALRPSPSTLATKDLATGYERLMVESQQHPVLFSKEQGGEIFFALAPSKKLMEVLNLRFNRFEWPLGTSDHAMAKDAAAFIYNAITVLETIPQTALSYAKGHPLVALMSLYEYLCFARADQGRHLLHIPPGLPQSVQSTSYQLRRLAQGKNNLTCCTGSEIQQEENGLYVARIPLVRPLHGQWPEEARIELLTRSPIVAALLLEAGIPQFDQILARHSQAAATPAAYEQATQEIGELIRHLLGPVMPATPMLPQSQSQGSLAQPVAPQDPGTLALLNALGGLLPADQKAKLDAIFQAPAANDFVIAPNRDDAGAMRFGALTKEFEQRQVKEGAWSNPRTRITMRARLEGLAELIGGHRSIDTLTRAELNALRDQLRSYPKNRHRLRATRNQPLSKIIQDGQFEPINARTAKKFFELARAVIGYAHDQGYLQENIAAGLTFSTKGAPSPRKRTYSPRQIELLLNGPVYTLKTPPRWRLDDYRFWLPLLGLYTGARLSELCQLQLGDIREELGCRVISISSSEMRQLKTSSSERLVPLHKAILEAGFLDFYQMRLQKTGNDCAAMLFENVRTYSDLSPGHIPSRWFLGSSKDDKGYLGLCGLSDDGLTFHGLRHSFINQFRRQKMDMLIGKALVGHADKSTTGGYGDCYPSYVLKAELDKMDFEIPTGHIRYSHYRRLQEQQGVFTAGRPVGTTSAGKGGMPENRHWKSYLQK